MKHIYFKDGKLYLLDQRKLPFVKEYVECSSIHDVAKCIKDMVVRGAPAIGVAAAYGMAMGLLEGFSFEDIYKLLISTRPTAKNLVWALNEMKKLVDAGLPPIDAAKRSTKTMWLSTKRLVKWP